MLRQGTILSGGILSVLATLAAAALIIAWWVQDFGATAAHAEAASDSGNEQTATGLPNDANSPVELGRVSTSQIEQRLNLALRGCFNYPENVSPNTEITLGFALDEQGNLVGIPQLVDDPDETPDVRRLYLSGLKALEDCAPFSLGGTQGNFSATIKGTGIKSVKDLSKSAPEQKPSVQVAERVVHSPATQESEDALSLDRTARLEIQRRLELLDFDPRGVDGIFGQNSRDAISAWQEDKGFPVSGYLNAIQLLALNAQSQAQYDEYQSTFASEQQVQRVRICRRTGVLGIKICRNEYR